MSYSVAILVGSLRKDSFNRKVAQNLIKQGAPALDMNIVEIGGVSFFNQDLEGNPPQDWVDFRAKIKAADAVLFVTPEYNRSMPGVLKNVIDVGSRPYGQSVFDGKPAAVVSASVGAVGGFGANHHLRQVLAYLNMPTMGQPEAYLGAVGDWFDEAGNIKNPKTVEFLKKYVDAFAGWIGTHVKK